MIRAKNYKYNLSTLCLEYCGLFFPQTWCIIVSYAKFTAIMALLSNKNTQIMGSDLDTWYPLRALILPYRCTLGKLLLMLYICYWRNEVSLLSRYRIVCI